MSRRFESTPPTFIPRWAGLPAFFAASRRGSIVAGLPAFLLSALLASGTAPAVAVAQEAIDDITGRYAFLAEDDLLAILEEEGSLKGFVDVFQPEDQAADDLLSYTIIEGTRVKERVEFKTSTIHRKFYRFAGKVERGSGSRPGEADYFRLVGGLEIVTDKGSGAEEVSERRLVIFKSLGPSEEEDDD